jgi:hypothetical protein
MVLFADDTSNIVTDTSKSNFETNLDQTFKDINTWFNVNLLILNFNKTQYVEFWPLNYYNIATQVNSDQINLINATDQISGIDYWWYSFMETTYWSGY